MKRYIVRFITLVLLLASATAGAQQPASNTQEQLRQAELRLLELQQLQQNLQNGQQPGQRGGGRGAPAGTATAPAVTAPSGAWWTNAALVQRLGLTEDQKAKIEAAYENHRLQIISATAALEREEAQLAKLLESEPLDRNAVLAQIDRVNQARGELERNNSLMSLEMRGVMTRAQWVQLKAPQRVRVGANVMNSNLITRVEPTFPSGNPGTVVLEAEISREGVVESVNAVSGAPAMIQAARDAVMQWRYKPTMLNGQPVAVVTTITFGAPSAGPGQRGGIQTPFGPVQAPVLPQQ
jgi:TonB family protein